MKSTITSLGALALLSSGVFAAAKPVFKFDSTIELPALSLLESIKPIASQVLGDAVQIFQSEAVPSAASRRATSKMPIINPRTDTDYKLWILAPDESINHKLIVRIPDIDASK